MRNALLAGFVMALVGTSPALAQKPAITMIPTPGCTTTPEQLAATKKAALDELHTPGAAKFAYVDPSYIQHNPARVKQAAEDKLNDYQELRKAFIPVTGSQSVPRPPNAGPQPPPGDTTEIAVTECDIVIVVRNAFRQDPTAAPGKFYEYFIFDAYRIKNGKVVEHWDQNVINLPNPANAPAPTGRGQ